MLVARIELDEILAVKYLQEYDWSPLGSWIAYLWNDGGVVDCWLVPVGGGSPRQLTAAKRGVTAMAWNPATGGLALVVDGDLLLAEPEGDWFDLRAVTATGEVEGGLAWSRDGQLLCLTMAGNSYLLGGDELWRKLKLPGKVQHTIWSPDSQLLAIAITDERYQQRLVLTDRQGVVLWLSDNQLVRIFDFHWLDSSRLVLQTSQEIARVYDWYLLTIPPRQELLDFSRISEPLKLVPGIQPLYHEEQADRRGSLLFSAALPSPDGQHLLLSLELDGWLHHYRLDLATGQLEQLTAGECEDFGQAGDRPHWSPNSRQFVYASNRGDLIRRDLWLYDLETRSQRKLADFPVTNLQPKWSPDGRLVAFIHADQRRAADLWVLEVASGELRQLTDCMPDGLAAKVQPEEQITYQGAADWKIDGFLLKPHDFEPTKQYPALVWVHGGPIRQMRGSWHPSFSYGHFYAVNQYLASRGFVTLSINYRGGIGYGKQFRHGLYHKMGVDDVLDVVNAGRYLKSLPYVDASRVGVYGLSYGGYMTLHCLTQYPEEFAIGVNFAGIWDYAQWARWIESRSHRGGSQFACFFGGMPDDSPALYAQGSPVTFREGLNRPLINFHGTKDANVDFAQLDRIVEDCLRLGKTYEAYYYPNEVHMFAQRRTWRDVIPKLERDLQRYLLGTENRR